MRVRAPPDVTEPLTRIDIDGRFPSRYPSGGPAGCPQRFLSARGGHSQGQRRRESHRRRARRGGGGRDCPVSRASSRIRAPGRWARSSHGSMRSSKAGQTAFTSAVRAQPCERRDREPPWQLWLPDRLSEKQRAQTGYAMGT